MFCLWWAVWSSMHLVILIDTGFEKWAAVTDAVVSNILLAGCCLLISNGLRYYTPKQEKYWYVLVVSLGFSLIWLLLCKITLWLFFHKYTKYINLFKSTSNIRFAIAFLINGCMAMMNLLWYTQQEKEESDTRKMETINLAKEAELYKLRQQLQPHFLFNSLNSISALTGSQPEKARNMIQQLSDFLRGTLKKDDQQWDTLAAEIQYLQLAQVVKLLMQAYPSIRHDRIVGHVDIAPGRKTDPGPYFKWEYLKGILA